jgi:putative transposase
MKSEVINKNHMSLENLNRHIRKLEKISKVVNRLHFIRQVYKTENIAESCEILDIPLRTGYNWVNKWNENGIEGLNHEKGAGRPSFLSNNQLEELDQWIESEEFLVTHDVYLYIKDNFGVDYSQRQVRRIVSALNYTWVKPYPIADEQVENAEKILKERTKCINPDKDIYGLLDEVSVQNTPNVGRIIKKKDLNLK